MEWHVTDAHSLALIDNEVGSTTLFPAEYEVLRRVIYATADFEYQALIRFSTDSLQEGAAALAAQSPIVIDTPMVQAGLLPYIQSTFANPLHCAWEVNQWSTQEPTEIAPEALGMQRLAQRFPEGIFIVGQSQAALTTLVELIEADAVRPALVVGTPAGILEADVAKQRLQDSMVPQISVDGRKGSAVVAVAIATALIDLAWIAYGKQERASLPVHNLQSS